MKYCKCLLVFLFIVSCLASLFANTVPVVSNVNVAQRTDGSKLVDIWYSVTDADGDALSISLTISNDNGTTYTINPLLSNLSGEIGDGIIPGANKHIVWNAGAEGVNFNGSQFRLKVMATELADLLTGLIAYYPFNGNTNDISGNNYHATNYGASLTTDRFGSPNKAYNFDGADDWMDFPDTVFNPSEDYTIAFWIKNESASAVLFNRWFQSPAYEDRWTLYIDNDTILFNLGELAAYEPVANPSFCFTPLPRNQFSFVVFQKYNNNLKMTVNDLSTQAVLNGYELSHLNNATWDFTFSRWGFIGYPGATWIHFDGILDDIRFYNRPLTDYDINALYHQGGWNGN